MTKILGFAGRKQSGKNTAFSLLLGIEMIKLAIVRDKIALTDEGKLWISDIFGESEYQGVFDYERDNETMRGFLAEYVYPYIKNYSFADPLKELCINVLGLDHTQCYGSDTEKNTPTHLKWDNMPGVLTEKGIADMLGTREVRGRLGSYYQKVLNGDGAYLAYHPPGEMTAREVLQFVGTEIFRKMYPDVWADATIRRIKQDDSLFSVITDVRFPNEVEAIKKAGGKVIRLTRNMESNDAHPSEVALDPDVYDWNNFDAILDNKEMSIGEQNQCIIQALRQWEWIDPVEEEKLESQTV
jgi:hypothetical protein